jgi:hypothetical protein
VRTTNSAQMKATAKPIAIIVALSTEMMARFL